MLFKAKKRVHNYLVHLINPRKFNKNLKYFSSSPHNMVWSTFISRSPSYEDEQLGTMITSKPGGRARTFKCLWGPGIDAKEWIPPAYVVWRAGTKTLFLLSA